MKTKSKWTAQARALRNAMQAAEMRGNHDIAAWHRENLNKELRNENQQAD